MDTGWIIDILIIVVALNASATITLWREAVRRPARPTKKFFKELIHDDPIVPKHGRPKKWTFDDDAYIAKYAQTSIGAVHRAQRAFFHDFADFADVINSWFGWMDERWRLEELADNELRPPLSSLYSSLASSPSAASAPSPGWHFVHSAVSIPQQPCTGFHICLLVSIARHQSNSATTLVMSMDWQCQ
jgi:hypothetical protein